MVDWQDILDKLIAEEGRLSRLYKDSKDIWTIGVGYNIEEKGLPEDIIDELLQRTVEEAYRDAQRLRGWNLCNGTRRGVLVRMVFQMGLPSVLGFRNMLNAIEASDWESAADEMLDSQWFREDSPARAQRESDIMRRG